MEKAEKIIERVMSNLSGTDQGTQNKITQAWKEACPKKSAQHTNIDRLDNTTLIINVDSPARLFQIKLQKPQILKKINQQISSVSDIHFQIGKVK